MENKKPILILIIIVIASLFFIFFFTKEKAEKTVEKIRDPITENLPQGVSIIKLKNENLPQGFPEIPLNNKKEMLNSYTLNFKDLKYSQKVIDFVSLEPIEKNFTFYKDWTETNDWKILYELNKNDEEARIVITKPANPLNINISITKFSANPKFSKINISYISY